MSTGETRERREVVVTSEDGTWHYFDAQSTLKLIETERECDVECYLRDGHRLDVYVEGAFHATISDEMLVVGDDDIYHPPVLPVIHREIDGECIFEHAERVGKDHQEWISADATLTLEDWR